MRALLLAAATLVGLPGAEAQSGAGGVSPTALVALDSVRVVETDSLFLSSPTELALGPAGQLFVSENGEGRVLEIAPTGRIARVFGRRGRGPGELAAPSTIAIGGDSLLLVWDRGARRLSMFDLRTGAFLRQLPLGLAWPPAMRVAGPSLLVRSYDFDRKTSLMRLSPTGDTLGSEGVLPALALEQPMLIQGAFAISVLALDGDAVFGMFELSPVLYRWQRGSRTAQEVLVPAARRRGVRPELFEEMLRDPGRVGALMWNRSIPVALELVTPGMLGLVTMDYSMDQAEKRHAASFHLTLIDVRADRACVDLPIPAPRNPVSTRDPLPRVALAGDRLIVLQQSLDARGESAPWLRRFRIDPARCEWTPLPR